MAARAVVALISLICVIGVVVGVAAMVRSSGGKRDSTSTTQRNIDALCKPAMYKETCHTTMSDAAEGESESATTEDMIKAAAKIALDWIAKNYNMTEAFVKKVGGGEEADGDKMAVDDCRNLLQLAVERLQSAVDAVGDANAYKDEGKTWEMRMWLSDVLTFQDNCMSSLSEVKGGAELRSEMSAGAANATEITMSVLDVVTAFSNALREVGYDFDTDKVIGALKNQGETARRLLGVADMVGDDGLPTWLSAADRRLLSLAGGGSGRELAGVTPNAVVAKDGSGGFKSINDALKSYKKPAAGARFVIHVKAGTYKEKVIITKKMPNILIYGDGKDKTIVTGSLSYAGKVPTSQTATFAVEAPDFTCHDMRFENTAGASGHQAVALRANNYRQVFYNCAFAAYQDTLYPQGGSQLFRDCTISGTVDFIFGNGATLIQNCTIIVRQPLPNQFNAVTAQGRKGPSMPTGLVIQDCMIEADAKLDQKNIKTYLGRPWKAYARTVFMESTIGEMVSPDGYKAWDGATYDRTAFYGEYKNDGPGAATESRVRWPKVKVMDAKEAKGYTGGVFLPGAETWLKPSGASYYLGFKQ